MKIVIVLMVALMFFAGGGSALAWNTYEDGRRDGAIRERQMQDAEEAHAIQAQERERAKATKIKANSMVEAEKIRSAAASENASRASGAIRGTGTLTHYQPSTGWKKRKRSK